MEYARDLGQVELWEESLRRSLERRGRPRRSSVELHRLRPARDLLLEDVLERSSFYSQLRRQTAERHVVLRPSATLGGVSALALLAAATVPKLLGGGGAAAHRSSAVVTEAATAHPVAQASISTADARPGIPPVIGRPARVTRPEVRHARTGLTTRSTPSPAHAAVARASTPQATIASAPQATIASVTTHTVRHASGGAGLTAAPRHDVAKPRVPGAHRVPSVPHPHSTTSHTSGGIGLGVKATTDPAATAAPPVPSGGYVNPLARARVTPERIDQGVDYSGSGTLTALGAGRVIATSGGGWPGNFIEYRLTSGAYDGRYVYYAEGVAPVAGLRDGQSVQPGQAIATMSGGIEIGWGSGVGTQPLAQAPGQPSSGGVATAAGRSFSALIASLGGPPGKLEG